jgi:Arc/MetJ-type ribon-helix-helix transcriptional regulator
MNIVLKPEQEQFVQKQLAQGQYATVDELIGAAFTLLSDIRTTVGSTAATDRNWDIANSARQSGR